MGLFIIFEGQNTAHNENGLPIGRPFRFTFLPVRSRQAKEGWRLIAPVQSG